MAQTSETINAPQLNSFASSKASHLEPVVEEKFHVRNQEWPDAVTPLQSSFPSSAENLKQFAVWSTELGRD